MINTAKLNISTILNQTSQLLQSLSKLTTQSLRRRELRFQSFPEFLIFLLLHLELRVFVKRILQFLLQCVHILQRFLQLSVLNRHRKKVTTNNLSIEQKNETLSTKKSQKKIITIPQSQDQSSPKLVLSPISLHRTKPTATMNWKQRKSGKRSEIQIKTCSELQIRETSRCYGICGRTRL